jgi:hypothetical protein
MRVITTSSVATNVAQRLPIRVPTGNNPALNNSQSMETEPMKKYLSAFALAAMIGITGCDTSEDTVIEDPVLEETTPTPVIIEPTVTTPPPMTTPATPTDSAAGATTPGATTTPPTTTTP